MTTQTDIHPQHQNRDQTDIVDLILVFWRSKFLILLFLIVGLIAGYFLSASMRPIYSANAKILMQKSEHDFSLDSIQAVKRILNLDTAYILTQIEILKSPALVARVVKKLNLQNDPEFARASNNNNSFETSPIRNIDQKGFLSLPAEVTNPDLSATITNFIENLNVSPVRGSYVVQVTFNSKSPTKAAHITNTLIDLYVQENVGKDFEKKERLIGWLDQRIKSLNEEMLGAEKDLEAFKLRAGLSETMIDGTSATQILDLNRQLSMAKRELTEAKILKNEARALKKSGNSANFKVSGTSSLVKELKLSQATSENKLQELSKRYGPRHPEIIAIKTEIENLDKQISVEVKKLENTLGSTQKQATARVSALEATLQKAQKDRENNNEALITLKSLQQKAETAQQLYKTSFDSYKRLIEKGNIEAANATVLSYANVPEKPLFPNPTLIIALCAVISTFLAIMIASLLPNIRRRTTN